MSKERDYDKGLRRGGEIMREELERIHKKDVRDGSALGGAFVFGTVLGVILGWLLL